MASLLNKNLHVSFLFSQRKSFSCHVEASSKVTN